MVANVQLLQRLAQDRDDARVAVPQVRDTAFAVAVDQLLAFDVPHKYALAPAKDKVNPRLGVEFGFAARHVAGESFDDRTFRILADF
jgi:hypothetical protein